MHTVNRWLKFRIGNPLPLFILLFSAVGASALQAQNIEINDTDEVHFGDLVVEAGDTIEKSLVVMKGDLTVRGVLVNDVVVMDGNLRIEEGGFIQGDALVAGGEIVDGGGRIAGDRMVHGGLVGSIARKVAELAEREAGVAARSGVAAASEAEVARGEAERARRHVHVERHNRSSFWEGLEELLSTIVLGLVLGALGSLLIFYRKRNLDVVRAALRAAPGRSALVGFAATLLVIPFFVVLVVALAVTIIGIPLLLIVVPLYPLLIAAAVALGFLAVAYAVGEKTAERRSEMHFGSGSAYSYLFTGLGLLLAPLAFANLLAMTGFLDFLGVLLLFLSVAVLWVLSVAGFGAVILTRAGERPYIALPKDYQADDEII